MNITRDLILIRHEEADGNVAMMKSKFGGDDSLFTAELRKKPSDVWQLTKRGRERCDSIHNWVEKHVPIEDGFRLMTSPSVRAMETACLILPTSIWITNELVRGRVWGGVECIPWGEWPGFCKVSSYEALPSGFHQAYPNGEAMVEVWKRTREFIDSLEVSALVVTHGEVVEMAIMYLEKVYESQYKPPELKRDGSHVRNGQVAWYSKRNPWTREILPEFSFKRVWFDNIDKGWMIINTTPEQD